MTRFNLNPIRTWIFSSLACATALVLGGCAANILPATPAAARVDIGWPSYNRTLTSERFVPLSQINAGNVAALKRVCVYDLGVFTSFSTGPLVIDDTLFATSEKDTVSIDAATCAKHWQVHEDVADSHLKGNRGAAYLDGRVFRGLNDGSVVAYDASNGGRIWKTTIANPKIGETVPAAPVAWNGMVFIGQAGGDNYNVKGRLYALDAATGKVVWKAWLVPNHDDGQPADSPMMELAAKTWDNKNNIPISGGATWTSYTLDPATGLLYVPGGNPSPDFVDSARPGANLFSNSVVVLDARTGAYRAHYSLVPEDFHDWDVSAAPTLFTSKGGRHLLAASPKDGNLYAYDLDSSKRLYQSPITTRANVLAPITQAGTRFCPGTQGGSEWNGPAYSPVTNFIYTGSVDWCATVRVGDPTKIASVSAGQPWTGAGDGNTFGKMDPTENWAGWVTATDAESGAMRWHYKAPAPVLAGVTATDGGLVFTADMLGNAYALDALSGSLLWKSELGGAAGGGVVSYSAGGRQYVAFAVGLNSPIWPTTKSSARIEVYALPTE